MSWKLKALLVMPLAAILSGESVKAPTLQRPIGKAQCPQFEAAKNKYLLAYALKEDHPRRSRLIAKMALSNFIRCGIRGSHLEARIHQLLK